MNNMKVFTRIGLLLFVAASLFATTSCQDEFQVEENQICGTWYFPLTLAPDTTTGFNWAGAEMIIKPTDTMYVNYEAGKIFLWNLRGNSVTATCTPLANVDEHWVVAFTVYDVTKNTMKITGKYRYIYYEDNTEMGDISCTLSKTPPEVPEP